MKNAKAGFRYLLGTPNHLRANMSPSVTKCEADKHTQLKRIACTFQGEIKTKKRGVMAEVHRDIGKQGLVFKNNIRKHNYRGKLKGFFLSSLSSCNHFKWSRACTVLHRLFSIFPQWYEGNLPALSRSQSTREPCVFSSRSDCLRLVTAMRAFDCTSVYMLFFA